MDKVNIIRSREVTCSERFQSLGPAFYRGSDLVVLTFDVSSVISMRNVWSWQQEAYEQGVHITTSIRNLVDDVCSDGVSGEQD